MCLNIRGFNPTKWEKIQSLPSFPHLDVIVLTEQHHLASFRPRELVTSGWNVDMVAGPQMTGSSSHQNRGGIALLTRISSNLTVKRTVVADTSRGFTHQVATWTLTSPSLARPIHVTGVYISPSADRTEEVFNHLSQGHVFPPEEPHLFMGDFNAQTQSCVEEHVSPIDGIFVRI